MIKPEPHQWLSTAALFLVAAFLISAPSCTDDASPGKPPQTGVPLILEAKNGDAIGIGGGRAGLPTLPLAEALKLLESENEDEQQQGLESIEAVEVTREVGLKLIEAAARDYPHDGADPFRPIQARLLLQLWHDTHPDFIPALEGAYDRLAGKFDAPQSALRILTEMQSEESLAAVLRLLRRDVSKDLLMPWVFVPLRETPDAGLTLFPGLLDVVLSLRDRFPVFGVILDYTRAGKIDLGKHSKFAEDCCALVERILESQKEPLDREWEVLDGRTHPGDRGKLPEDLVASFADLEMLFDLFGFLPGDRVTELLRKSLELRSVKLRVFAASSLVRKGQSVSPELLEEFGTHPSGRALLWVALDGHKLELFPERHRNQLALAEANMVQWLEFPTEYGCSPEAIEFLKKAPLEGDEGPQELYFFKFRRPGAKEWHVGVAGPYPAAGPARLWGADTFSRFETLESEPLEEQIKSYVERSLDTRE